MENGISQVLWLEGIEDDIKLHLTETEVYIMECHLLPQHRGQQWTVVKLVMKLQLP
jgi:hypothetical protein